MLVNRMFAIQLEGKTTIHGGYVVVYFLSQVIFVSLLFLGMLLYANEVETKEKEKLPEKKKLTTTDMLQIPPAYPWRGMLVPKRKSNSIPLNPS